MDENEEEMIAQAATAAGHGTFVPHYCIEMQMGVPAVVGVEAYAVYDYIRANTYFGSPKKAGTLLGKLAMMREQDGKLGAWLSHARLSEAFGWSVSTVNRHLAPLRDLGWCVPVEIDRSLRAWAYIVGEYVETSQGTRAPQFYREAMIESLHKAMRKHAFDLREHASLFALTPAERLAFTRTWIEKRLAKKKAA